MELELKHARLGGAVTTTNGAVVEGYASLWGSPDSGGDTVERGAYARSLARLAANKGRVRMLWQHDPREPIGVWDDVDEDQRGLKVKGRILTEVGRGREAAALLAAGAIDGLSIGYRAIRATKEVGGRRLAEIDLWEVSLVTFPMLAEARVAAKGEATPEAADWREMARAFEEGRAAMAGGPERHRRELENPSKGDMQ